jgi:Skp family chaperone for outer membrane proteins
MKAHTKELAAGIAVALSNTVATEVNLKKVKKEIKKLAKRLAKKVAKIEAVILKKKKKAEKKAMKKGKKNPAKGETNSSSFEFQRSSSESLENAIAVPKPRPSGVKLAVAQPVLPSESLAV